MLRANRQQDLGATAMLVALSLVLLMGIAAVAVDYGLGINERRQDQTAADNSALGAGVELIVSGDLQTAVDSVKTITNENLGRIVTDQQWIDCQDPDQLGRSAVDEGLTPGTSCISFGQSASGVAWNRIRVRIPEQTTDTAFAKVLGATGLVTDAAAEVELEHLLASGAFPAGVFFGADAGEQFCIKTGTGSGNSESCGAPSTGDFGNFQPYFYTELSPGNPSSMCASGNQPAPLARVMADGLDHQLGFTETAPGTRVNGADCPSSGGPAFPDRVDSGSGYSNTDITNGLVKGGSYDGSYDGRLTRKPWPSPYRTADVFGPDIDNRPLWSYIDGSVATGQCAAAASGPDWYDPTDPSSVSEQEFLDAHTAMIACLSSSPPSNLFVNDLYLSPRLTIVPRFHQNAPIGNNACCYDIAGFVPAFINGIWTANGPQWTCDQGMTNDPTNGFCKHEPGRVGTIHINASGQQKIDSADAIVLSCEVLPGVEEPEEKCKKVQIGGGVVDVYLNLFLVK